VNENNHPASSFWEYFGQLACVALQPSAESEQFMIRASRDVFKAAARDNIPHGRIPRMLAPTIVTL
jgi:hypothetical protein